MRSDSIKKGVARTPHRSLLMATGVSKKNMNSPFIGIASSFSDLVPGHIGMHDLERQIEKKVFIQEADRHSYLVYQPFATGLLWVMME